MGTSLLTCCCGQPSSEVKGVASVGLRGVEGRCGEPASQPSLPVSGLSGQSHTSTPGRMLQRYLPLRSAGGIPGLREKGSPQGTVWKRWSPAWGRPPAALASLPAHFHSLCLSRSPGHCGDPAGVVTSSLLISFSHSLGSGG